MAFYRSQVLICGGTGCTSSGSMDILKAMKAELKKEALKMKLR
jgi:NADH:ubiquinone oxidoreductase subunit E